MTKSYLKTQREIDLMSEGGKHLAEIKEKLAFAVKPGVTGLEIELLAQKLIKKAGGVPSFAMVPGYSWATCININEVVVHGIPGKDVIHEGDKVGIDVGIFYKGWHTDTSTTVAVESAVHAHNLKLNKFLETGKRALKKAIEVAKNGKRVADISKVMQDEVEKDGYSAIRALTGHGIGRELHEEPAIPCFVVGDYNHSPLLRPGMVIAIEVMYNMGGYDVVYKNTDGWTIITADGKISGLFEETVAIEESGPRILTQLN